jgi:hypothetical protein
LSTLHVSVRNKFNEVMQLRSQLEEQVKKSKSKGEPPSSEVLLMLSRAAKTKSFLMQVRYASLRYALLRFASLRFVTLRYASLRFVTLCYASLRCIDCVAFADFHFRV